MPKEQDTSIPKKLKMQTYAQFRIDNIYSFLEQFRFHFLMDSFFFRGQANSAWGLESSYDRAKRKMRNCLYSSEYFDNKCDGVLFRGELEAISYYQATNDSYLNSRHPKLEVLSEMQHYGASTRLLDVTESFGVALFFAITGNTEKKDAAIWAINKNALLWNYLFKEYKCTPLKEKKGYYVFNPVAKKKILLINDIMFSKERKIEMETNKKLCDFAEELIGNKKVLTPPNHSSRVTVYPGVFPVQPMVFNNRLHAQNGLFLLQQSLEYSFKDNLLSTLDISLSEYEKTVSSSDTPNISEDECDSKLLNTALVKFIIPYSINKDCISILKSMNINYKSLFPDKYGIIKTAEKKYFPEE